MSLFNELLPNVTVSSVLRSKDGGAQEPEGHRPLRYEQNKTKLLKNTIELI